MLLTCSACAPRVIVLGAYQCLCVSLCQLDKYFSEAVVLYVEMKIQWLRTWCDTEKTNDFAKVMALFGCCEHSTAILQ